MMRNILVAVLLVAVVGLGSFWLFKNSNSPMIMTQEQPKVTIETETLFLKGSNTVGESFAPRLAEAYLKNIGAILVETNPLDNPVEKIVEGSLHNQNKKIQIDIRAHGSSTGFKALSENTTQIAMSSRKIKQKEYESLTAKFGKVVEHPIALDALAIVTYTSNPVDTLTIEQIAAMFSGELTNWRQVGGEDKPIILFSRDDKSGTWDTFNSMVLKPRKLKLNEKSARFESSNELVNNVVNTDGSLGFVGVAYVGNSKLLNVSLNTGDPGTQPSGYTIGTQAYPLSRKLYLYTIGEKHSELSQAFIQFVTQNEGQKQAEEAGLISYYPTHFKPKTIDKKTPRRYRELAAIGRRITVNFSHSYEEMDNAKELRDLERLENFANHNPGRKIVLVDFSNSARLAEVKSKLEQHAISVLDTMRVNYKPRAKDNIEVWVL